LSLEINFGIEEELPRLFPHHYCIHIKFFLF